MMMTISARNLALFGPTLLMLAGAAHAAQDTVKQTSKDTVQKSDEDAKPDDDTAKRAGDIVTQPVRDVGLSKKEIPPILLTATQAPYAAPKGKACSAISGEMAQLNAALGPDFGVGTENNENKVGKIAAAGGSWIVNSLIPFRGLVREVSGAASQERRLAAAVAAGMARRGYLRGLAQSRGCRLPKVG
jgi:hypothetical protein